MSRATAARVLPFPDGGARKTNLVDRHVGTRVRLRRLQLEMSQGQLADTLGITFQQIQKYERGVNRIGAGRLSEIATALQVAPAFFFEDELAARDAAPRTQADPVRLLARTRDGLALAAAFNAIADRRLRTIVVRIAEMLAARGKR